MHWNTKEEVLLFVWIGSGPESGERLVIYGEQHKGQYHIAGYTNSGIYSNRKSTMGSHIQEKISYNLNQGVWLMLDCREKENINNVNINELIIINILMMFLIFGL